MSDGDSGIRRYRHCCSDSRHNLKVHPGSCHGFRLFPASAEHKRIAAFQPDHEFPCSGSLDEELIDFGLVLVPPSPPPAYINPFCGSRNVLQQGRIGQVIVQDDLGTLKAFFPFKGDQAWIARPSPYEIYLSTPR
jgi:hypothetical protein